MAEVWYEHIDTSLKEEIQRYIKVRTVDGTETIPVHFFIRRPDDDFRIETYPSVSIYNIFTKLADYRQNQYENENTPIKDVVERKHITQAMDVPFDAFYQIDFWAVTNEDMNNMTNAWIRSHPFRQFNLKVLNGADKEEYVHMVQTEGWLKNDFFKYNRIFNQSLRYKIQAYVDPKKNIVEPLITKIQTDVIRT